MAPMQRLRDTEGFTLTEMAIVLVILALLLGGLLMPLSAQRDLQKSQETQRQLSEIREALIGFAILNRRLPCPDTDTDPTAAGYGTEETDCSSSATKEGYLPWKTLGVSPLDPWGSPRTGATAPRFGDWRYRVDRNFAKTLTLSTDFSSSVDKLSIKDNSGNTLTTNDERPVAIVFSAGPNLQPDEGNASFEPVSGVYQAGELSPVFDDQLVWISRPLLFNRLVAAGKLP